MFLVTPIASQLYTAEVDFHPHPGQRYELFLKRQRKSGKSLLLCKLFPQSLSMYAFSALCVCKMAVEGGYIS